MEFNKKKKRGRQGRKRKKVKKAKRKKKASSSELLNSVSGFTFHLERCLEALTFVVTLGPRRPFFSHADLCLSCRWFT